jgi:hypothetical protein
LSLQKNDFANLPAWAEFAAQDVEGTWWAYEAHPNKHDHGWYEHEAGRYRRLKEKAPNPDWERALIRIEKVRSGLLLSPRLRGEGRG